MGKKSLFSFIFVILISFATGCNKTSFELPENQESVTVAQDAEKVETNEKSLDETVTDVSDEAKDEITVHDTDNNLVKEEPEKTVLPTEEPEYVSVSGITLTMYDVTLSVGHTTMPYVTMTPHNATNKGEIWESSDTTVATVDYLGNIKGISEGTSVVTVTSVDNKDVYACVNVKVIPEAECTYIDGILIANKTYPLPQSYAPGWDATASDALQVMFNAAKQEGIHLFVKSGYRSYIDQKIIYNDYVKRDGKKLADTYSARPGHSEHQTGLAFDLNSVNLSFADTPEGKWLAENCHEYGFIIRYPKDKEEITGYIYEPWHVRYLGTEKAKEVFESGLCLEEFLGITSVYSY